MRIVAVDATAFALPFRAALTVAGRAVTGHEGVLVRVRDAEGRRGYGEAPRPADLGSDAVWRVAAVARACLRGAGETTPAALRAALAGIDTGPLQTAFEMALYDLAARGAGKSLAALLGPVRRRRVPVNALLECTGAAEAAARATALVARGYPCIKMKLTPAELDGDTARLAAIRGAVGPKVALRLDANAAWTVGEAVRVLPRLAVYGIEYVEQPVPDIAGLATVRGAVDVALAADECVADVLAVEAIASLGAAEVVVIKPARLGLQASAAIAATARRHGLDVVVTSVLDTSIGIAAALHFACTLPGTLRPCGLATGELLAADLVQERLLPAGGTLMLPSGPGLGVEIGPSALRGARRRIGTRRDARRRPAA